ncbi:MAG TPA: hypothetical protein VFW94_07840 [Candidatus Acidoferrales bacterium]|nr:hypothetical protein [Candidatus Acidoferrales bacterium]
MSANRLHSAVRTLEKVVFALFNDTTSASALQHGRLAVQLRRRVTRLKRLSRGGPENEFWDELRKATLDVVKYLRRIAC